MTASARRAGAPHWPRRRGAGERRCANLSVDDYKDWKRLNTVFTSLDVYNGRERVQMMVEGEVGDAVRGGGFRLQNGVHLKGS